MAQRSQDPLKGWAVHTATEWRLSHKLMSAHSKHAKSHCCTYSNENKTLRNWQACTTTKEMCTVCEAVLDVEQKHDFYPIHAWIRWFLLHISDLPQLCCVIVISLVILGGIPTYPLFIFVCLILLMPCHLLCAVWPSLSQVWANCCDYRHNYTVSLPLSSEK